MDFTMHHIRTGRLLFAFVGLLVLLISTLAYADCLVNV
jgi:hypothetical protein